MIISPLREIEGETFFKNGKKKKMWAPAGWREMAHGDESSSPRAGGGGRVEGVEKAR